MPLVLDQVGLPREAESAVFANVRPQPQMHLSIMSLQMRYFLKASGTFGTLERPLVVLVFNMLIQLPRLVGGELASFGLALFWGIGKGRPLAFVTYEAFPRVFRLQRTAVVKVWVVLIMVLSHVGFPSAEGHESVLANRAHVRHDLFGLIVDHSPVPT